MKIFLYSFYDKVSQVYCPLVNDSQPVENVVEVYHRDIKKLMKDEKTINSLKDKNLYLIGEFDDKTGRPLIYAEAQLLIDFDSLILNNLEVA